jgi:hypothetical protein
VPGIIPCRVVLLTAEDTIEDTLVPRLKAAKADLKLIEELKAIRRNNRDEMFLLGEDLDTLEQMIRDFGDVGLVTIDPITAYMGHAKHFDSHRATDVRSQLSPLKKLAEQTGVAFSAITHPPKNASPRALDHFIGSQAFIAAARIGHLCVAEMEEGENGAKRETGRRFFTNPKINIEARQPTLIDQIDVVDIGFDEDSGMVIKAPVVRWEGESDLTAEEALAASRPAKGKGLQRQRIPGRYPDQWAGVAEGDCRTRGRARLQLQAALESQRRARGRGFQGKRSATRAVVLGAATNRPGHSILSVSTFC